MCIRSGVESDPRSITVDGANQIVDEWHGLGVDGIKILGKPGLWPDIFQTITTRARKYNMGVAVHIGQDGVYPMNAVRVAADGASTIEHHYGYAESSFESHNDSDFAAGIQLFERGGSISGDGARVATGG